MRNKGDYKIRENEVGNFSPQGLLRYPPPPSPPQHTGFVSTPSLVTVTR